MYSTKRLNKNLVEGNKFITVGNPYKEDHTLPRRWKGKQFQTEAWPANADNGHFSKLRYTSEPFQEMERFTKTQPLDRRKLGFGTKDAFKRGEFTATIRTEQYREMLTQEQRLMDASRNLKAEHERIVQAKAKRKSSKKFVEGKEEVNHLYDIGRSLQNEFNPNLKHDAFYEFKTSQGKRMGPYRTMAQDIGNLAWEHRPHPPEFGPINYTKNFYDRSHLACVADDVGSLPREDVGWSFDSEGFSKDIFIPPLFKTV